MTDHRRANNLFVLLLIASSVLPSCVNLRRSNQSGYAHTNNVYDPALGRDRRARERQETLQELGVSPSRELSDAEDAALESRIALKKAEKALEGRREREQYFKNKPHMRSDRERLEFLRLDTYDARQRWLNSKGVLASVTQHTPPVQAMIDVNDIALGFTKQAVRDSWGEPDLVEVAGNPIYGNERWHYSEQTSSTEGYRSQHRLVYFESGRVTGWESR